MNRSIKSFLILAMSVIPLQVLAEDGPIKFTNEVMKEVIEKNKDGEDVVRYVEPIIAVPGNTMRYTITFENLSDQPISDIVVDDPIPNNLRYLANSAEGQNTDITFSVDGEYYDVDGRVKLTDESGKTWEATADQYKHIRWVYRKALMPGEKGVVRFKARIRTSQE